ncbi:HK97 gp10 family phage protein [Paenibacillus sinopodophylli]|uniref:HK97 gp10 family phage protein n=1 Tax=Paenibacillus sinopodophylli TaxID=1837342 RepID=UPI00110D12DE|nr:HK97 gp10 family phage protein [Paenibacillus sinopodophylli]
MSAGGLFDISALEKMVKDLQQDIDSGVVDRFVRDLISELGMRTLARIKQRTPVGNGQLRNSFQIGSVVKTSTGYEVEVFTNLEYASFVENGFRAHWVPGHWVGNTFVYESGAKTGMQVGKKGGWVPGRFMVKISVNEIEEMLPDFLARKQKRFLERLMNGR